MTTFTLPEELSYKRKFNVSNSLDVRPDIREWFRLNDFEFKYEIMDEQVERRITTKNGLQNLILFQRYWIDITINDENAAMLFKLTWL